MQLADILLSLLRVAVAVVVLLSVLLWFWQDRMIFFPRPLDEDVRRVVAARPDAQELSLPMADGTRLHGWFIRNGAAPRAPVLIYFGGNAEEVSGLSLDAGELPGVALLLVNYRGYGKSEGSPGEQALFADALALYDHLAARPDVDPARIVLMGRSLGAGVAVWLASQRPVAAVVLVTPYDSITEVAKRHYPLLPVGLLLRHPFDAVSRAPAIRVPALALIAREDQVIPAPHAQRLMAAWGGPKETVTLDLANHDTIGLHPGYWPAIRAFLGRQHIP